MDVREYPGVKANLSQLVNDLRAMFDNADYEVQVRHESPAVVLQARKSTKIRDWTGTSYALTVKTQVDETGTQVAIGKQKWLDKAAVSVVTGFLTGGVGFLAGAWGGYQQYHITDKAWDVVEKHLARKSGGSAPGTLVCPECRVQTRDGRFCSQCGVELISK